MKRPLRLLFLLLPAAALLVGHASSSFAQSVTTVIVPRKSDPNQTISFSFQQADIDDVLRFLADASGKIVFKDSAVSTTVTIRNQTRLKVADAIKLVQSLLALKGFALIETDDALIVTTTPEARTRRSVKVTAGKDLSAIPTGKEIITHIFPLSTVDAVQLRSELTTLFPAGSASIVANADTNSLIVVDEADNVRRIGLIIQQVDRDLTDEVQLEVIRLQFADATEVARYLTELFRQDTPQPAGGGGGGAGGFGGFGGFGGGGPGAPGGAAAAPGRGALSQLRGRVRFAADVRSNAVLVYASPANIRAIKQIIEQIDVNLTARTEFRIIPLKYADATGMADQLNQLLDPNAQPGGARPGGFFGGFGGFGGGGGGGARPAAERGPQEYRVVPDVRTNSLIITAPIDAVQSLEALVRRLDQPSHVSDVVRIFQLENAIASEVATTLRNLFQGTQQQGGFGVALFGAGQRGQIPPNSPLDLLRQVTIVPNDQTNQLLISGPAQTFPVIEELLDPKTGLDKRLPQVFIEVIIADVTLDDSSKFGIEWNAISGTSTFGTNFGLTSPTADNTGFRYSVLSKNIQATLQALKTTDRIKIISTPHVMVTDNSPALVSIGESIPYAGETTITNGVAQTSTAFQDVAIELNVTPHISRGISSDHILLDIDQQVNSLIGFVEIGPGQSAPRTTRRRAGTTVIVENDQTVVLGGIISNDEQNNVKKVPILGDLPFVGQLFRSSTKAKRRTELVVFLTPHVVSSQDDADQIRKYERSRLEVDPLTQLQVPFDREKLDIEAADIRKGRRTGKSKK